MCRLILLYVFIICPVISLKSQIEFKGNVIDIKSNSPIEFVNIGFPKKGVGTVSSENGEFVLIVPDSLKSDSIVFSHINYKTKKIKLEANSSVIPLTVADKELPEVVIIPNKIKSKWINKGFGIPASSMLSNLGEEVGIPLDFKKEVLLRQAKIKVKSCSYDSVIVRVNLYDLSDGTVGNLISTKPLYTTIKKNKKTQEYILDFVESIKIRKGSILLSMECVAYYGDDNSKIVFPTNTGAGYSRSVSLGNFDKIPFNTGMSLKVTYLE